MAERLVKAAWYENAGAPPDKFVLLVDIDGALPDDVLAPFTEQLPGRLDGVGAEVLYAFAQWHLEAWYFADATNLRGYLGRALGHVDTSRPDEMRNPKLHLKSLFSHRVYTARSVRGRESFLSPTTILLSSFRLAISAGVSGNGAVVGHDRGCSGVCGPVGRRVSGPPPVPVARCPGS